MSEEHGEAERLEPVVGPRVRKRRILVEQLAHTVDLPDCGGLEDVELGIFGEQLLGSLVIASVNGLEKLRHGILLS
jgi:hypothetical protein